MNENEKEFLKYLAVALISAFAGGIISALVIMSHHSFKVQKHIHFYPPKRIIQRTENDFIKMNEDFDKFTKKLLKKIKHPEIESDYIEEDYIIIPRQVIDNLSNKNNNIEPFRGPYPPKKRENWFYLPL